MIRLSLRKSLRVATIVMGAAGRLPKEAELAPNGAFSSCIVGASISSSPSGTVDVLEAKFSTLISPSSAARTRRVAMMNKPPTSPVEVSVACAVIRLTPAGPLPLTLITGVNEGWAAKSFSASKP